MKLYKISSEKTYLDIGHGFNKNRYVIWVYLDGKVKTSPIIDPSKGEYGDHSKYFGCVEDYYIGRYDVDKKILSIVVPEDPIFKFRNVPKIIINNLKYTFPNIEKIYVFNQEIGLNEPHESYGSKKINWYKKSNGENINNQTHEQEWLRDIFEVDGLKYMQSIYNLNNSIYEIGIKELEEGWKKDIYFYLKPGHSDSKSMNFKEWMKKGIPIEAPEISVDIDGSVNFIDGRHRFTTIRDMGKSKIAVSVSQDQDPRILNEMGAVRIK